MSNRRISEKRRRARRRLGILIAVGSVLALFVLAILIDSALSYNKVHTGVSVAGHDIGGLTHDEAVAVLAREVDDSDKNLIVLKSDDRAWKVMPTDVGTKIDIVGAVGAAMDITRESNFLVDFGRRLKLYFSDIDIPLEGTIDTYKMDDLLHVVAQELDDPPVDAGIVIDDGKVKAVEGKKGTVVDQDKLREDLKALLFTLHGTELEIPMVVKEPGVQADDNREALEQAETMIGGSVKLVNGDNTWTLSPEKIAGYMDFTSENRGGVATLVPYLSAERLGAFFDSISDKVATKPVSATFDSDGSKAWVVPAVMGKKLDREKTAEALTAAALKASGRTAKAVVTTSEPDRTTEEAEAMGIKEVLGTCTTEYGGTADRQTNVKITTKYATNVLLAPGEVYNFDKQIGARTEERGYKLAKGITGQGKLEDVLGGGICQVSTTLFNAVFVAGLEVLERHNHSLYISHYPDGRDATVTGGGKNLRFRNNTDRYIWVRGRSDGYSTTFNIYGTKDGRKVTSKFSGFTMGEILPDVTVTNSSLSPGKTSIQVAGQQARYCEVKRTVTWPNGTKKTDIFKSYYPAYAKTIEVSTGTTTTTTTTTTKPTSTTKPSGNTTTTKGGSGPTSTGPVVTEF
ncbi:MAG: VanW family protein [Thermoleophilia bacterium]|nr:VanW family protein [Thermoleophilia bacterium]